MLVYAGIDEAGYGPLLGPLCVGCSAFIVPDHDPASGPPDLWTILRAGLCRAPGDRRGRIAVEDSKRLKGPNDSKAHPLRHLERGVLSFASVCADPASPAGLPERWLEDGNLGDDQLFQALDLVVPPSTVAPWYGGCNALPLAHDAPQLGLAGAMLRRTLTATGVRFAHLSCHCIDALEFNRVLARTRSKASLSFDRIARIVDGLWRRWPDAHPRVVVDRQGGRMLYREPLATCFPEASITILGQTDRVSRYRLQRGESLLTISFEAESEGLHLPTALASMTAKFCRELLMLRLNRWFGRHKPSVRPTAGYVADGRRWLAEMSEVIEGLAIDREGLVRSA